LHLHVIFELLGNSWQIMQVSTPEAELSGAK
jgi:hypothetical protein